MIVYLANKYRFREDILSNRIEQHAQFAGSAILEAHINRNLEGLGYDG